MAAGLAFASASASTTSTPVAPTPPPPSSLSPKALRRLHNSLLALRAEICAEQSLLEQLWYVSHAQFRSAKWFHQCDGVRRRLKRVVVPMPVGGRRRKTAAAGSSHRQPASSASPTPRGLLDQVIASTAALYYALWSTSPAPPTVSPPAKLAKVASPPDSLPPSHLATAHLVQSLQLFYLLAETRRRARAAFVLLEAHVNTPPAPTFATLTLSLLAISAKIHGLCSWGGPTEQSSPSLAAYGQLGGLYAELRAQLVAARPGPAPRPPPLQHVPTELDRCPAPLRRLLNTAVSTKRPVSTAQADLLPLSLAPALSVKRPRSSGGGSDGEDALPPVPKKRNTLLEDLLEDVGESVAV